jgi:hypothetical protein
MSRATTDTSGEWTLNWPDEIQNDQPCESPLISEVTGARVEIPYTSFIKAEPKDPGNPTLLEGPLLSQLVFSISSQQVLYLLKYRSCFEETGVHQVWLPTQTATK